MTIRVAFPLIGGSYWTGGYVYLKNTLSLIQSRLSDDIQASVFLSAPELERYGDELKPLIGGRLLANWGSENFGSGLRLAKALVTGSDARLAQLLSDSRIDAAFEVARFYGYRFPIPLISWMPDFQHREMPQMFSRLSWLRREAGFRTQIRAGRTLMLSSETARSDLEKFYPGAGARAHVVRFATQLDIAGPMERANLVRAKYGLPERFYFLPNQFWKHKNHDVVVAALRELKTSGDLARLPPIVLSGLSHGQNGTSHFDALLRQVSTAGIESHFRYLGLIPYEDVLGLNATCDALINPSCFEGWSTPIEEGKALGTPLILADIRIHREQAPQARFFDPGSGMNLASTLLDLAEAPRQSRPPQSELVNEQNERLRSHAQSLLATVRAAVRLRA